MEGRREDEKEGRGGERRGEERKGEERRQRQINNVISYHDARTRMKRRMEVLDKHTQAHRASYYQSYSDSIAKHLAVLS